MNIGELVKEAGRIAREHGFHEGYNGTTKDISEKLCLIHSELSEALEEMRLPEPAWIPRFGTELADAVIRIADLACLMNIDLEERVASKMARNESRPKMHGKAF